MKPANTKQKRAAYIVALMTAGLDAQEICWVMEMKQEDVEAVLKRNGFLDAKGEIIKPDALPDDWRIRLYYSDDDAVEMLAMGSRF